MTQINNLLETGGPLYGVFNIPIMDNPDGEAISEIGDPVAMVGDHNVQDLDNRPPCISGTSWTRFRSKDDKSEAFIAAVGLYTHPSFHERCQNNGESCHQSSLISSGNVNHEKDTAIAS